MQNEFPDQVVAVTLSVDHDDADTKPSEELLQAVITKLNALKMDVQNIIASDSMDEVLEKYHVFSVPFVVVYGKDGTPLKEFEGEFAYKDDVAPFVRSLLRESE